jgi:hypothetical protein
MLSLKYKLLKLIKIKLKFMQDRLIFVKKEIENLESNKDVKISKNLDNNSYYLRLIRECDYLVYNINLKK